MESDLDATVLTTPPTGTVVAPLTHPHPFDLPCSACRLSLPELCRTFLANASGLAPLGSSLISLTSDLTTSSKLQLGSSTSSQPFFSSLLTNATLLSPMLRLLANTLAQSSTSS